MNYSSGRLGLGDHSDDFTEQRFQNLFVQLLQQLAPFKKYMCPQQLCPLMLSAPNRVVTQFEATLADMSSNLEHPSLCVLPNVERSQLVCQRQSGLPLADVSTKVI